RRLEPAAAPADRGERRLHMAARLLVRRVRRAGAVERSQRILEIARARLRGYAQGVQTRLRVAQRVLAGDDRWDERIDAVTDLPQRVGEDLRLLRQRARPAGQLARAVRRGWEPRLQPLDVAGTARRAGEHRAAGVEQFLRV